MATLEEIETTLDAIGTLDGYPTALLLTTSEYPTPPQNVNLQKLRTLSQKFPDITLGYSDHTQGNLASIVAISFGACIFERHFTLDNSLPGPDHWFSVNPSNLKIWSDSIKTAYQMMGSSEILPTESETKMKTIARRSIVSLDHIELGETLNENNIGLRRPGTGLPPKMFESILGKKAIKKIKKFTIINKEDFA
jgi:sialic acid synthase SpsE